MKILKVLSIEFFKILIFFMCINLGIYLIFSFIYFDFSWFIGKMDNTIWIILRVFQVLIIALYFIIRIVFRHIYPLDSVMIN